jgi:GxxExxY protein
MMEMKKIDLLSNKVIGTAIEVHRNLGPGLLESVYQQCLAYEFSCVDIKFEIEKEIPVKYKKVNIDCAFRADFIIEDSMILELKTVERILPIHKAQVLTYLKLTSIKLGIIINFNVKLLKNGIKRVIL